MKDVMNPNWDVTWLSKVEVKLNHTEKGGHSPPTFLG